MFANFFIIHWWPKCPFTISQVNTELNINITATLETFVLQPTSRDHWTRKSMNPVIYFFPGVPVTVPSSLSLLLTKSVCFSAIIFALSVITNGTESCLIFFLSIIFLSCFYFPIHTGFKISQRNWFIKKLFECFSQHTGFHFGITSDSSSQFCSPNQFFLHRRNVFKTIFLKVWYAMLRSVRPICMTVSFKLAMVTEELLACYN